MDDARLIEEEQYTAFNFSNYHFIKSLDVDMIDCKLVLVPLW